MNNRFIFFFFACLFFFSGVLKAQDTIYVQNTNIVKFFGKNVSILTDDTKKLGAGGALASQKFRKQELAVPTVPVDFVHLSNYWVKMVVKNQTEKNNLVLNLAFPTIDSVSFYKQKPDGTFDSTITGEFIPFYQRSTKHQDYIFDLNLAPGTAAVYLLKITSSEPIELPLEIGTGKKMTEEVFSRDVLFGLYAGIILVMLLYNLFLFFTVRDRSYLYYVGYIFFTGLTQACLQGYATRFLYPDSYFLANACMVWVPALSGIFSILFINNFLQVKSFTPGLYQTLNVFVAAYCGIIVMSFFGRYLMCISVMQGLVTILALVVYFTAVKISLKKYRPANFFLIAWTIFIIAVVIFVLRSNGVLPYNEFTNYAMQIGSAIEVVMLSFALADKINLFRKEKEESQAQAMVALQENERIVREQNVILEKKVGERTHDLNVANTDLNKANTDLNKAMKELKDAETQLVESEKMASLGQLTAGIAHEINNPINFVTSNVRPLNRDVRILLETVEVMERMLVENCPDKKDAIENYKIEIDYDYLKEEIDQLLSGISDGASRTAEIVKGLRIFSRLDEDDLKKADINEGMDSTLVITNNLLNNHIAIDKRYGNLPLIECYPGKLNQVFLNMISNAVYAVKKKFGEKDGGIITITTSCNESTVTISIADNGTGMDENTKKRLFEPFFTTKDVGEGTGLGLSIAYNTINKHNGTIQIDSELGRGTAFIIQLPLMQK